MTKGLKDIIASEDDMVVSYKLCYRVVVLHRRAKICCVLFFRQDLVGGAWVHHVMIYVTSGQTLGPFLPQRAPEDSTDVLSGDDNQVKITSVTATAAPVATMTSPIASDNTQYAENLRSTCKG